jgi:histidinol-phosphate/aromatic aminotransferase/cobyric acid decarboxylase-like protein
MSKDFGIAGIRAGYVIMNEEKIKKLLENGYLWNSNGFSEYFFRLYSSKAFLNDYENIRRKYILETSGFFQELSNKKGIKLYPSKANFALIELINNQTSDDFVADLLIDSGIYVRTCSDKIGLDGEFVRIASRTFNENQLIINSLK